MRGTGKCALNLTICRALVTLIRVSSGLEGAEANLKWVEEWNEEKKRKTMHNFPKEMHGHWRQG